MREITSAEEVKGVFDDVGVRQRDVGAAGGQEDIGDDPAVVTPVAPVRFNFLSRSLLLYTPRLSDFHRNLVVHLISMIVTIAVLFSR